MLSSAYIYIRTLCIIGSPGGSTIIFFVEIRSHYNHMLEKVKICQHILTLLRDYFLKYHTSNVKQVYTVINYKDK